MAQSSLPSYGTPQGDASGKNVSPNMSRGRGSREVQCSHPRHECGVRATDDRKIEVLAQDLPCFGGAQLAIDVTLRSAVVWNDEARPHAAEVDGAVLLQARTDKEIRYPELTTGRCKLVVVAVDLLWKLSSAKARDVPHFMTHQAALVWERRWSRMLSTSCALAFAASLVEPAQCDHMCEAGGSPPSLAVARPKEGRE